MGIYETVLIARQDLSETQVKELTETLTKLISDNNGKVLKKEQWGLRSLAYKINKSRKGHYTLIEFEAPGQTVIELERVMRINEDVMRYLTIKLEEPTEGPSVMMEGDDKKSNDNKDRKSKKEAA